MSLVKPGTYSAHPVRLGETCFAEVYEKEDNGNLVLHMAYQLDDTGHVLHHWQVLAKNGAPNLKTVADLKERFGWDGLDPTWFVDADLSEIQVEAVVEDEYRDGKSWSKIKWINTPGRGGGGGAGPAPKQVDRRSIQAKYGSLFRACAGPSGKPASAAPKAAPSSASMKPAQEISAGPAPYSKPPTRPPAPPAPPAKPVQPSTLEACWSRFVEITPDDTEDGRAQDWYVLIKDAVPGKQQDDFGPMEWGSVMLEIDKLEAAKRRLEA